MVKKTKFLGTIRKGDKNGMLEITIPKRNAKYEGFVAGDIVNVEIKG